MFFKKLIDNKIDKVKFDSIHKTNGEYVSVTYGCIRIFDSYRFLASSLDSLDKTLVINNHRTLKNLKRKIFDKDEIMNFINEIGEEDRTIEDLKKDDPNEIEKIEEVLLNCIGKTILNFSKRNFQKNGGN